MTMEQLAKEHPEVMEEILKDAEDTIGDVREQPKSTK